MNSRLCIRKNPANVNSGLQGIFTQFLPNADQKDCLILLKPLYSRPFFSQVLLKRNFRRLTEVGKLKTMEQQEHRDGKLGVWMVSGAVTLALALVALVVLVNPQTNINASDSSNDPDSGVTVVAMANQTQSEPNIFPAPDVEVLPDFAAITDVKQKKQAFFDYLTPMIDNVFVEVQQERQWVSSLASRWQLLSNIERARLTKVARRYGFTEIPSDPQALIDRVDIWPKSMVLAQAANESAWGTSRFAVQANNLFGQWCFTKGCGLVPAQRSEGSRHEVRLFHSVEDSVRSYVLNLNRHYQYEDMRSMRAEQRASQQPLSGYVLIDGLLGYSQRGEEYVNELRAMIRVNRLASLDTI